MVYASRQTCNLIVGIPARQSTQNLDEPSGMQRTVMPANVVACSSDASQPANEAGTALLQTLASIHNVPVVCLSNAHLDS
jgi:hypothetical protein